MKSLIATALMLVTLSAPASAACFGSGNFQTCSDSSGNNYTVNRFGNMTTVQGSSMSGNTWNQTSQTFGNQTYTNGTAANGRSWNETQTQFGNGNSVVNGTNSRGQVYNYNCNAITGCN